MRAVHDVQQERRIADLFERALERIDETVRQFVNEAHRIDEQRLAPVRQSQHPHGRVERREQLVLHQHAGVGETVHQGRFPGVRIADQSNDRIRNRSSLTAVQRPRSSHLLQTSFQHRDSLARPTAVDFELGLTGTSHTDTTTTLTREVEPRPGKTRHQVLELSQLYLKLALLRGGSLSKDVEDELGAVHDFDSQHLLEVAPLHRRQLVVEEHDRRAEVFDELANLLDLAGSDQRLGIRPLDRLDRTGDDFDAGRRGQAAELSQGLFCIEQPGVGPLPLDCNEDGLFGLFGHANQVTPRIHGYRSASSAMSGSAKIAYRRSWAGDASFAAEREISRPLPPGSRNLPPHSSIFTETSSFRRRRVARRHRPFRRWRQPVAPGAR